MIKVAEFNQNDWSNKEQPLYRFNITNSFLKEGDTLLDIGAGTLDLYQYLLNKGRQFNYIGIELNKKLYPIHQRFKVPVIYQDFLNMNFSKPIADISVCWGLTPYFTFRKNYTKWQSIYKMIDNLLASCKRLFLFDVWVEDKFVYIKGDETVLAYDPEQVFKYLRNLNTKFSSMTYPLMGDKEACWFLVEKK